MGDFLGFSFNGYRSDELGLVKVSDGDRYKEEILPEFEDKTVEIPGNDGTYYYGSYFKEKTIEISVAFDHLTEVQFKKMRRIFGNRNFSTLIFDEEPYKMYKVKVASPPEINYVCFDEIKRTIGETQPNSGLRVINRTPVTEEITTTDEETGEEITETVETGDYEIERESITPYVYPGGKERIYKGEMDISFIAYNPFAIAPYKDLDSYSDYENVDEWIEAAGLKTREELQSYDTYNGDSKEIKVYNPGDLSAPFQLYLPFEGDEIQELNIGLSGVNNGQLRLKTITRLSGDDQATGVWINTKNHLIEGIEKVSNNEASAYITTGYVYNQFINGGNFFQIPCGSFAEDTYDGTMTFSGAGASAESEKFDILYDYRYY